MCGTSSPQTTQDRKPGGYEFYRNVLGSPKYVGAPMVDQSELAYRKFVRRYGAQLVYTPMINAKLFSQATNQTYRTASFDFASGEEGSPSAGDRPLIVQFCANDADQLLASAKIVEKHCDAVDINLGCPQEIARRGRYGSFLQEDWVLIYKLINTLHKNLSIPVTAKFRVFPTVERTVEYAKMLESAGAQILTCHGRIREQRGQNAGLADWDKIAAVKAAVKVPVFANGNVLFHEDIQRCLDATGCDGVMSAEGVLYNPALFVAPSPSSSSIASTSTSGSIQGYPRHADLALEYLSIVRTLTTKTAPSAVKGHLFKLMRPAMSREKDLREKLGKVKVKEVSGERGWREYVEIAEEMKRRMDRDTEAAAGKTLEELVTVDSETGLRVMPHWLAQPYWRPLPKPKGAEDTSHALVTPVKRSASEKDLEEDMPHEADGKKARTESMSEFSVGLVAAAG